MWGSSRFKGIRPEPPIYCSVVTAMTTRADFVIRPELHVRGEPKRGIRSAPETRRRIGTLVLLCHKFRCPFRAAQHGQRESAVARAATNLRRIVAIEFGTWRSGRNGGCSGLVTFV
jgi:hypothetical protein